MKLTESIDLLKRDFEAELSSCADEKTLDAIRVKYLARNGQVAVLFEKLKDAPRDEKPHIGRLLNELRNDITSRFDDVKQRLVAARQGEQTDIDVTLPGRSVLAGTLHPVTQTIDEIVRIFTRLGFNVATGPELEDDFHNFSALNFPPDHPSRDMQDTFFVNDNLLLRTHTSPVQIRYMMKHDPPVRIVAPGRVFRNEAVSARSHMQFHQVEGLYVDNGVSFADLKGILVHFAKEMYGSNVRFKFIPSFFPFTEPSAEMYISCFICEQKGCRLCKHTGWLEILGSGMVHPNVLTNVGYDSEKFTGYAFGIGIERTALLKYGINDIRMYFENDVRFLRQF